jgi:hypothetical protein
LLDGESSHGPRVAARGMGVTGLCASNAGTGRGGLGADPPPHVRRMPTVNPPRFRPAFSSPEPAA